MALYGIIPSNDLLAGRVIVLKTCLERIVRPFPVQWVLWNEIRAVSYSMS